MEVGSVQIHGPGFDSISPVGSSTWTVNTPAKGAWVAYDYDAGPYIQAVFGDELSALRYVVDRGHGKVTFLEWGVDICDHLDPATPSSTEAGS